MSPFTIAPAVTRRWTTVGLLLTASIVARGDDDDRRQWQPYFKSLAAEYQIAPKTAPDRKFKLKDAPVLRWSQPVRGGDDGALFLWLDEGRPAVIAAVFCWPDGDGMRVVTNEFHSLTAEPIIAIRGGTVAWAPTEGVTFQEFKEAPTPAETETLRLVQMRRLAERFRGENFDDFGKQKWELRLLPKPLFRHEQPEQGEKKESTVLDGALFTLASGTDPEILLLIEARATSAGARWHWALSRFSDRPLTAWLDDQEVWAVERARSSPATPYYCFQVDRISKPPKIETAPTNPATESK